VELPGGRRVQFPVEHERASPHECVVVKDAGDDPDCTDGARLTATAAWAPGSSPESRSEVALELRAGAGVGVVTLPGLGLPVGGPSITAVPRRMIARAVAEALASSELATPGLTRSGGGRPLVVTFSVPGGEEMAVKTSNARLGIAGGISILGTTGIVRPFSTAAYRASVVQQIEVAAAQGQPTIALATGARSDAAAQRLRPDLAPVCFVEVGDFTGVALRRTAAAGITSALWVGMVGKITKLAGGVMMTHFHRSNVDGALLAEVAIEAGAPPTVVQAATATATARHFFEVCVDSGSHRPLELLCERASAACRAHAGGAVDVEVVMVDFDGREVVARG
jgi:cobalt-precorrin-5B (C1)-methyltransferase